MDKSKNRPPIFKTWYQVYWAVIINLAVVVLFLYWFSTLYR